MPLGAIYLPHCPAVHEWPLDSISDMVDGSVGPSYGFHAQSG